MLKNEYMYTVTLCTKVCGYSTQCCSAPGYCVFVGVHLSVVVMGVGVGYCLPLHSAHHSCRSGTFESTSSCSTTRVRQTQSLCPSCFSHPPSYPPHPHPAHLHAGHLGPVNSVAFHHSGNYLLSGASDNSLKV